MQAETFPFDSDDARWDAVAARDATADGRFVFAVTSTGVYCRPGCPARRPRRANVAFYPNGPAARADGFRPCKRCEPDAAPERRLMAQAVTAAAALIEPAPDDLLGDTFTNLTAVNFPLFCLSTTFYITRLCALWVIYF